MGGGSAIPVLAGGVARTISQMNHSEVDIGMVLASESESALMSHHRVHRLKTVGEIRFHASVIIFLLFP